MKSFNDIIIEAKKSEKREDPYRLVVLVERPKKILKTGTSAKLTAKAEKLGV